MYGLEHHIVEINGDVTDAGRTNDERTREDRATQPMDAGWLSFAKMPALQKLTHIYVYPDFHQKPEARRPHTMV